MAVAIEYATERQIFVKPRAYVGRARALEDGSPSIIPVDSFDPTAIVRACRGQALRPASGATGHAFVTTVALLKRMELSRDHIGEGFEACCV